MQKVRVGVVGVGYLGSLHAEKFSAMENVDLVGVVDIDPTKRDLVAYKCKTKAYENYKDIVNEVDAVSIAVPTTIHYEVGRFFIEHGKDVFMEKPLASTVEEGKKLVELSKEKGVILQVGHLERFNGAFTKALPHIKNPLFLESERIGPFRERGLDVDVILDLMIHDIDLISYIVKSEVREIKAVGVPVLTDRIDIAQAWIEFKNGAVANVTASRVSRENVRKLRVFQTDGYLSIDFLGKKATYIKRGTLDYEIFSGYETDPLMEELKSFVDCVIKKGKPPVSGEDGLRVLIIAELIKNEIGRRLERHEI